MLLSGEDRAHIRKAAECLAEGGLFGLPTETVYGLAARADDDGAVAGIFEAKGRPADHPLIVHVLDAEDALRFAASLSDAAERLMKAFWPGPLTVIAERRRGVAGAAAGGHATIGLRCPAHPLARAVLEAARDLGVFGVAAPSANRFGRVSPTTAEHVVAEFGPDLLVLDGGRSEVGIESTIVDCSGEQPALLRPGVLLRSAIESAAGTKLSERTQNSPRASGTLAAHYAPDALVRVVSTDAILSRCSAGGGADIAIYARTDLSPTGKGCVVQKMPEDAVAVAHELFSVLRSLDASGVREIWIETPPSSPEWEGVLDRISRAAAASPQEE
ncbi:MAG: L-threonylcarbamoyladenylate synthase [Myxococcota bacterium]